MRKTAYIRRSRQYEGTAAKRGFMGGVRYDFNAGSNNHHRDRSLRHRSGSLTRRNNVINSD